MITASLALALALRSAVLPLDTVLANQNAGAELPAVSVQAVLDSPAFQPARFDATRFDTATAETIRAILDTASAHGIPTRALISLAYQGAAAGAPGIKISNKVRAQYVAMVDARAALGENSTESELASGADALRQGMDGKALVAIRAARPVSGSALIALVVATDLMKRSIQPSTASDAVLALCRTGKSDDKLNGLQQLVARNAERGPGMAQDALDRYLKTNAPGYASPATSKPVTRPPGPPDVR